VRYADEAYNIGPAPARDSYLRIDRIVDVARRAHVDAIHPGYGFLAENPDFAQGCLDAGIAFVGPPPSTISAMGDKVRARQLMQQAGIPVVPGGDRELATVQEALEAASLIGYPVLVKALAGGGGKGMRRVDSPDQLAGAFRAASAEAASAFGRPAVYLERLMEEVRHVEIQILGDKLGNVIHMGERECSIQRRHQKLIEESPSTAVNEKLRRRMGATAVQVARAANYHSVGTVEFLLDRQGRYFFLEMNTRLQVEHPVTELVTGIDLVVEQLRVASGRRLRYYQEDIKINGAAIECRISAEDPYNDFLPSIGRVTRLYEPSGPGVRVDSGVFGGCDVSLYYDPLIAKVAVWGDTRGQAILRMKRALKEYKIIGVKTNIPFHLRIMDLPSFLTGRLDTAYFDRKVQYLDPEERRKRTQIAAIAAALVAHQKSHSSVGVGQSLREDGSPWRYSGRRSSLRGQ
jgi:acetyl-CoA carboxylase biotin carboxylase subunit